jgi:hypothetical protein
MRPVTALSAACRQVLAVAGVIPPRRPWAVAFILAGFLTLVGCGGAPSAGNVFTTQHQVSLGQVNAEVTALYGDHPALASFTVQDVAYTTKSRQTVLRECTTPGTETGQIDACAPLIFYYYSYGKQASVPAATSLAGDLYWYAVDHITGSVSVQASLNELLQGWKLPVPGLTTAQQRTVIATSVLTAAGDTMLTEQGVHIVITDQVAGAATTQRITADMGASAGSEAIAYGSATATIRVTKKAAYFTGSTAGLTSYIGLSASAAAKVGARWVEIKAGTSEYQDLATENTISALAANILPSASQVSVVSTATVGGQKVYILGWTTTPSGSSTPITARLTLTATPKVLPVSETLTTKGESKTTTFSDWGHSVVVATPPQAIPYASAVEGHQ